MKRYTGSLLGRVSLQFAPDSDHVPADLSGAATLRDGTLVVAADERASLEILRRGDDPHVYAQVASHAVGAALGLADEAEIDIEGMAVDQDGEALYFVGSHSAKRKKPRGKGVEIDLERLATVKVDPARFVLARAPLAQGQLDASAGALLQLPREGEGSLLAALRDDPHLGRFLPSPQHPERAIAGKDNGFDVEGLAVYEGRMLLGLRGPVLRGWAFVLDLELTREQGALALGGDEPRYHKHALDLDGLGVRDLFVRGDDVLILAGPTMVLDGVHRLYRWRKGPHKRRDSVVEREPGKLEPLFDIPFVPNYDRAEGLASASWFEPDDSVLVVYDAPSDVRRPDPQRVLADVFAL